MIWAIRELSLRSIEGFKQIMAYLKLHKALIHFDTRKRQHILSSAIWLASMVVITVTNVGR